MNLTQSEVELFYKLWYKLMWGINEKHVISPRFTKPVYDEFVNEEPFVAVRNEMWKKPELIDEFLQDSGPGELTETERGLLTSWRNHYFKERFLILKHLSKYSVFMPMVNPAKLYAVYGIKNPLNEVMFAQPPVMVQTVLLPFNDKIIYDSMLEVFSISFGKGMRESFKSSYNEIKATTGIIVRLDAPPVKAVPPVKASKLPKPAPPSVDTKGANVPKGMSARYMEVAGIIEAFCDEKLNEDEFKDICLRALAKLCRKRPSPIMTGRARTWACGIVYAIGSCNFIFDRSQSIYTPAADIADWFGLAKSTAASKSYEITKLLNLSYFNAEFLMERYM